MISNLNQTIDSSPIQNIDNTDSSPLQTIYSIPNKTIDSSPVKTIESEYLEFITKLNSNLESNKFNLEPEQINFIKSFIILSPNAFNQIIDEIQILKNSNFDIHEIPKLILIVANVFKSISIKNNTVKAENIITLIKVTLDTIIESNILPLPEIEKNIIEYIINHSLDLLSMNILPIEKKINECCRFLFFS